MPEGAAARFVTGRIVLFLRILISSLLIFASTKIALPTSVMNGEDLVQDYLSARAWIRDGNPYADLVRMRAENGFPPTEPDPVLSNPHPFFAIILVVPISGLHFPTAFLIWKILNCLALGAAWTIAWELFSKNTWKTLFGAGWVGLWAPVWQGLDFGQPTGVLCLLGIFLWKAAKNAKPNQFGILWALACCTRPFFFLTLAAIWGWNRGSRVRCLITAALFGGLIFILGGKDPWSWWRENASASSDYAYLCGTLGNLFSLGSRGGIILYAISFAFLVYFQQRYRNTDCTFCSAWVLLLLTYPLAWYHYDALAIPAVIWLGVRASEFDSRIIFWFLLAYLLGRALPSTSEHFWTMMYVQIFSRISLGIAVIFAVRLSLKHAIKNPPVRGGEKWMESHSKRISCLHP
ncbi:DUF2029 domain-containing protein [Telmatocola sphagniphila]|uniref:DUF2029 domain-containing protein n=1 Tax=Telmatocola sphagniphila TaxID=1123043 RepID=A0A8E6B9P7_9BACT|nr:glycosyltransferase 87 family protein [Telmatocola sphagniphila]QVL33138.1 DUF2029 domain-containing protein [Telmatocola sphagniphila]